MTIVCSAPGKLFMLGEYVVLEGAPAMVMAVDKRAIVRITPQASFSLQTNLVAKEDIPFILHPQDGTISFTHDLADDALDLYLVRSVIDFAEHLLRQQGKTLPTCTINIDTSAFFHTQQQQKFGLGSSAALTTALLAALLVAGEAEQLFNISYATPHFYHALWSLVQTIHHRIQGHLGSGADIAASIWGGLIRYQRINADTIRVAPLALLNNVYWQAIWSGKSMATASMLQQIQAYKMHKPHDYWAIYEKLAIYANAGAEFWQLGNATAFLSVLDAFQTTLHTLGISAGANIVSSEHQAMYQQSMAAGGFYKVSGAGGGDMGLLFATSASLMQKIAGRFVTQGFAALPMKIDPQGIDIKRMA